MVVTHNSLDTLGSAIVPDVHDNQERETSTIGWAVLSIGAAKCYRRRKPNADKEEHRTKQG
jgi:hypothetical protein